MRLTMPHMGYLWVTYKAVFNELGVDLVLPPAFTLRTMTLGVKHSPEGLCIPFKLNLGNFIEALDQGADTIAQVGGTGVCRLGYYARVQELILRDMGYDFEMMTTAVSEKKFQGIIKLIRRLAGGAPWTKIIPAFKFGIAKISAVDTVEKAVHRVRARELEKGSASRILRQAVIAIDQASSYETMRRARDEHLEKLLQVPQDSEFQPLQVGVMGEFYVVLESFSNLDVEAELGKLGVEVHRSLFISDWIKFSLFLNPLGFNEKKALQKAAMPYLARDVGGDGWESVGEKVYHAGHLDGLVHLAPFTCMPEIIAQNIMPSIKEDIPVLTLLFDEQTAKPGMLTRLEAFVDLLKRRRNRSLAGVRSVHGSLSRC
jgi:predicted nucleotide-binding protein (sugar kinase/HSP70/actin superfamily)